MKYVISGPAVDKVLRENGIRIAKGELIVSPLDGAEGVEAGKDVAVEDSKDVKPADTKSPKAPKKAKD